MGTSVQSFAPPRGMRDFYPEDMRLRNHIFDAWRRAALAGGFAHYDACVVENLELLERKAGEEIARQIYNFEDKSGRRLALRPEMTPTLARMIVARQGALAFPLKWFTIAQCFRYERMTLGRKREHYQWNLDIVGETDIGAEVEILNTAVLAMRAMGVPDGAWRLHISNRQLLADLLAAQGIAPEHHAAVFLALDKRGKLPEADIAALLAQEGVGSDALDGVLALLNLRTLDEAAAVVGPDAASVQALRTLLARLDTYGIGGLACFDLSVIRGLAYYTDIVFEAFDADRRFRALFGGGRYDNLLSQIGGADISAVGLGFGDVVVAEMLAAVAPETLGSTREGLRIGFMTEAERLPAMRLAARLRAAGQAVGLATAPQKPKTFFTQADKTMQAEAILIGPDDIACGQVRRKNLSDRSETVETLEF